MKADAWGRRGETALVAHTGALLLAVVLAACDGSSVTTPAESSCTTAALQGTYGSQRNGQTAPGSLLTAVGLATFDGRGTLVERQTMSVNGTFSTVSDVASTYSIDPDCIGTQRDAAGNVIARLMMVHGADEVLGMGLVAGNNVAVHFERIEGSCSNATLRGDYGFQRNGQAGPGIPLLSIGTITFDGAGNQTGSQLIARNGTFSTPGHFVGAYAVKADCTGTQSDSTRNVFGQLVVVHGGEEVLGMSLTAGNNVVVHFERVK